MADDRMAIVCKKCKLGIAIAKFWHNGGWLSLSLSKERGEAFLAKHALCDDENGYIGRHQYYLGYEIDGNDWVYDDLQVPISKA